MYRQCISDNSRAHAQIAFNIAEDLERDVWRAWTEAEFGIPEGGMDSAPGTHRSKNVHRGLINPRGAPVALGRMRFIVDTKNTSGALELWEKYSPWPNLLFSTLLVDPVVHWDTSTSVRTARDVADLFGPD